VPVIESTDRDTAAVELMELVLYRLELEAVP